MPGPVLTPVTAARPDLRFAYRGAVPTGGSHRHTPVWYSAWLIEHGWAEVRGDDSDPVRAQEGSWLCCAPYVPRYQVFAPGAAILSIAFHLVLPEEARPDAGMPRVLDQADVVARLRDPALDLIRGLYGHVDPQPERRYPTEVPVGEWLLAQAALARFCAVWLGATATPAPPPPRLDPRLIDARALLAENPRMGKVPYDRLCRHAGLSRVHLDRLFHAGLGCSPKAELDRLCFERVLRRLADPHRPIKGIAAELGFTDTSHLCRWFRKRSGQSPEMHRAAMVV